MTNILSFIKQIKLLSEVIEDPTEIIRTGRYTGPEEKDPFLQDPDIDIEDTVEPFLKGVEDTAPDFIPYEKGMGGETAIKKKPSKDPMRTRIYASLKEAGFPDAENMILNDFPYRSKENTITVLHAINEGIETYNKETNKNEPTLNLSPQFISNAEVAFAKLYIRYYTWYVVINEQLLDGNTFSYALGRGRDMYFSSNYKLRNMVRSTVWPLFKSLNYDLQERIKITPDKTGLKNILNIKENSDISSSISGVLVSSLLVEAITPTDFTPEVSEISLRAVRRSIVKELLKFTTDPTHTWDNFDNTVADSFWRDDEDQEFASLSHRKNNSYDTMVDFDDKGIIDTSPTIDSRNDQSEEIEASTESRPDFISTAQEEEVKTKTSKFHITNINRFTDISDNNLILMLTELIKVEYIGKQDIILLPPVDENTELTYGSLFKWLAKGTNEPITEETIDFLNLFSDILNNASGTSLPISEKNKKLLDHRVKAFAMKNNIISLQDRLTPFQAQQKVPEDNNDFFDQVIKMITSESILTSDIKRNIVNDITTIKNSQELPVTKYLKVLESIFDRSGNSTLAYSISSIMKNEKIRIANPEYTMFPKIVGSFTSQQNKNLSLSYINGIPAMQKLGLQLPISTYPPVETLLFAPSDVIQGLLDSLELIPVTLINKKNHDAVQLKLESLLKFKTTGNILEAHAKVPLQITTTRKDTRSQFINQCLPIIDLFLTNARYLVYFIRNLTHSSFKVVQERWDPASVKWLDITIWKKLKRSLQESQINTDAVHDFVMSFIYNKEHGNILSYQENLYPEDISKLQKLIRIIQEFITTQLNSDPNTDKIKLDQYKDSLIKLSYSLSDSVRNKVSDLPDLGPIKEFLREYEVQIKKGLYSRKGTQNSTTKLIDALRIHNIGTTIGIHGVEPEDIENELTADRKASEGALSQKRSREIIGDY